MTEQQPEQPLESGEEHVPRGPQETAAPGDGADDPVEAAAAEADSTDAGPSDAGPVEEAPDELTATRAALAERTTDLQRLQAEYVNYKRRVERDRQVVAENATYQVLAPIVEVLDTIDRARQHDELDGGFKAVAEQLERAVSTAGLVRFAEPGDPFDPTRHDALSHMGEDPEVEVTTVKVVAKAGYAIGDRVVRAAQVLVVDPAD